MHPDAVLPVRPRAVSGSVLRIASSHTPRALSAAVANALRTAYGGEHDRIAPSLDGRWRRTTLQAVLPECGSIWPPTNAWAASCPGHTFSPFSPTHSALPGVVTRDWQSSNKRWRPLSAPAGERYYLAELYRLGGELSFRSSDAPRRDRATDTFRQAIAQARGQQARSWELRAATSLMRAATTDVTKADAREQLSNIYRSFTEGLDEADAREARALLGL